MSLNFERIEKVLYGERNFKMIFDLITIERKN